MVRVPRRFLDESLFEPTETRDSMLAPARPLGHQESAPMTATEEQAQGTVPEVTRPSARTLELPRGPTAPDRAALLEAIAAGLLEVRGWRSAGEIGDSSFLCLDTDVGGKAFYVQFLSRPGRAGLLCEVASGVYADASMLHPTPEQGRAMESLGFSDGRESNFRKELVFDAPDAAVSIAAQTLSVLEGVFGWRPESVVSAKLVHSRSVGLGLVLNGLTPDEVVELLTRHGVVARLTPGSEAARGSATVDAAMRGGVVTVQLLDPVENTPRYRAIAARARVGSDVDPRAANPFNALTWAGRSWVKDQDAYVESTTGVVGVTEDAFGDWLQRWDGALSAARYWYRRIALSAGQPIALTPLHFSAAFHNVHRMARSHVKPAAEEAALEAFGEYARSTEEKSEKGLDAWAFFERYTKENPAAAMPIECEFVSSATAADLVPWLERIDGLQVKATETGALEVFHAVPGGTLLLSPSAVRRVALSPERFGLSAAVERGGRVLDVLIGSDDFYFAPSEGRVELESGITFVAEMRASISWFETKHRLQALERELAWAGTLASGATLGWMAGALSGAEAVGLACGAERLRFDNALEAARRSWKARVPAG
jgi:hypothetical protein